MIYLNSRFNKRVMIAALSTYKLAITLLAALFFASTALAQLQAQPAAQRLDTTAKINAGFDRFVAPELSKPLWEMATAYNAGHLMMAPMIAAFRFERNDWLDAFEGQFTRYVANDTATYQTVDVKQTLTRLHYVYLASTFVALAYEHNAVKRIPAGLAEKLFAELNGYYQLRPTWWYAPKSFAGGIKERVEAKLDSRAKRAKQASQGAFVDKTPLYYDGFADDAAFVLAGLANLAAWERANRPTPPVAAQASQLMLRVLREYGEFRSTGYVFQPGQWADHPDYAHAGYLETAKNLPAKPKPGLAEDTSHASRWPIFIQATRRGLTTVADKNELTKIEKELARQFYNHVLITPSTEFKCFRLTNYADGYNGLYRYAYSGRGDGFAYEGYMSSAVLFTGWWMFLPPPAEKRTVWNALYNCLPLQPEVIEVYIGPLLDPTQRKSKAISSNEFNNGKTEFRVLLHAKLVELNQ